MERIYGKPPAARLDTAGGREAGPEQLRRSLATAPPPFLEGALDNEQLAEPELLLLLRNRMAPPHLLARIGRDRGFCRSYAVKKALVCHPRTPVPLSRNLAAHLFWRDLVEVSANLAIHPVVRRQAEQLLRTRLDELTLGERIALARCATRGVIPALLGSSDGPVLRALLDNPRMIELDVGRIAASATAPPELLRRLAAHPRWGTRPPIRLALLRNSRMPVDAALHLVQALTGGYLQRLSVDDNVPAIVRIAAGRRAAPHPGQPPSRS